MVKGRTESKFNIATDWSIVISDYSRKIRSRRYKVEFVAGAYLHPLYERYAEGTSARCGARRHYEGLRLHTAVDARR